MVCRGAEGAEVVAGGFPVVPKQGMRTPHPTKTYGNVGQQGKASYYIRSYSASPCPSGDILIVFTRPLCSVTVSDPDAAMSQRLAPYRPKPNQVRFTLYFVGRISYVSCLFAW